MNQTVNKPKDSEILEFLKESNAIEEVHDAGSLNRALEAWEWLMERGTISGQIVRHVHKLLAPTGLPEDQIGSYRKCRVSIAGQEAIQWPHIPADLSRWCKQMNKDGGKSATDRELDSKTLHVLYEKIHPFVDGNGRTGRMFMNWYRLRSGLPLLIIHTGKEQTEYYKWFK